MNATDFPKEFKDQAIQEAIQAVRVNTASVAGRHSIDPKLLSH